ncbi:hypothetical protein [Kitasatospora sp. NPDC101183]|uniref:hypothetical protein n=1 Tax=Kitasatospora sp. NPDC101183 TaxID=3364100 RepID=UPI0037FF4D8E
MTVDGAFALAATGGDGTAPRGIADFFDRHQADASGSTADDCTGIGTVYAGGGAMANEALLAQVVGRDPRAFGGHDLIAGLDGTVCTAVSKAPDTNCPAVGASMNSPSVFSRALGIMAEMRAGNARSAAAPVSYLESQETAAAGGRA